MRVRSYCLLRNRSTDRVTLRVKKFYNVPDGLGRLTSPEVVYEFASKQLRLCDLAEEETYLLAVDTKSKVLGLFLVSHGTMNSSILNPREILMRALLVGACSIIILHNHPSLDTTPSEDDILVTRRVKDACALVGVTLLDHVIIGDGYYSLKENLKM